MSRVPRYVQLFPTLRCNAACSFCFVRGAPPGREMDLASFERLIGSMVSSGIDELDILGGEPTLHPELPSMLDICASSSIKTTMSTNGSQLQALRRISGHVSAGTLTVGVSLNGQGVKGDLNEYIVEHKPLLKSVCTRERTIPDAAGPYLAHQGIRYYLIYFDALWRRDLSLSIPFHQFFTKLRALRSTYGTVEGVYCSCFIGQEDAGYALGTIRCPGGTTKISVMPNGDAYPCYLLMRHEQFRLGNALTEGLSRLFDHPVLDTLRRFRGNPCRNSNCEFFTDCRGGCPAVSLLLCGDLHAPDPRCAGPGSEAERVPP